MGNTASTSLTATNAPGVQSPVSNMAIELKPAGEEAGKVKPCCVCKDEKALRDECMLFSNSNDPQEECKSLVDKYRSCMKGYGFDIH